ncbi:MAG: HAD-IA family hydrolase [Bacteroidales bacterium]
MPYQLIDAITRYNARHCVTLNIKSILTDMDGVIYDSMKYHSVAWAQTMNQEGISCTADEFYLHEGRTGRATINIYFSRDKGHDASEEDIQRIYAEKARRFTAFGKGKPMPGALEFLTEIKQAGYKIVLVTGSGQRSLLDKIDNDFHGIFTSSTMVTAFDVKIGKPNPEPYLIGLKKAGVKATEAIVIENAPLGIEAGVSAGIFTIGVNTGPLPDELLYEAGADIVFPDIYVLTEEIRKIIY